MQENGTLLGKVEDPNGNISKSDKKNLEKEEEKRRNEVIRALEQLEIHEIRCGISSCRNNLLQKLSRKEAYLFVYCLLGLAMGMYFTYSVSTISTIEKRFKLTSKQTGVMLAGNDISQVLFSILVSYFGNYGNRPRWVAIGAFSASVCCILSALPHWIYGPGEDALEMIGSAATSLNANSTAPITKITMNNTSVHLFKKMEDFCLNPYEENCDTENSSHSQQYIGALVILFIGQFFVGLAVSLFYSIGFAYLDDNVQKNESPVYHSVSFIVRVVGPVLGYFLGSRCLSKFILPEYQPNISPRDPRWLGAWWLGYILLAIILAVKGSLMLFFPRTLPSTLYDRLKRIHKKENPEKEFSASSDLYGLYLISKEKEKHTKPSLKKLPIALKRLLMNKIYIGKNFSYVLTLLAYMGYWSFKPKYLEFQFRTSASQANLFAGIASLVASIVGLGISALVLRVFKPNARIVSGYACFLTIVSPLTMIGMMFIGCSKLNVQGPSSWSTGLGSCNTHCGCSDRYAPVCSTEGSVTFYSPCFAGCNFVNTSATPVEYYDCECAPSSNISLFLNDSTSESNLYPISLNGNVTQGYCEEECDGFKNYLILVIISKLIHASGMIGSTLLFIRSIEQRDKGLALGFTTVLISLFAFIPAPIMMGAIVDSACLVWDETCGVSGNCWLYDSDKFRVIIHAVPAALLFMALIGDIIVFVNSKSILLYEDEEDQEKPKETTSLNKEMTTSSKGMK